MRLLIDHFHLALRIVLDVVCRLVDYVVLIPLLREQLVQRIEMVIDLCELERRQIGLIAVSGPLKNPPLYIYYCRVLFHIS